MQPGGGTGSFLAWDQTGVMWIWAGVRRRIYVCSFGIEHRRYWRTHWQQGRNDYVACDHEVNTHRIEAANQLLRDAGIHRATPRDELSS
jgi:hypothetical protein